MDCTDDSGTVRKKGETDGLMKAFYGIISIRRKEVCQPRRSGAEGERDVSVRPLALLATNVPLGSDWSGINLCRKGNGEMTRASSSPSWFYKSNVLKLVTRDCGH